MSVNICFNLIFLIEELDLRFANMWTYKIFEISNIYSIQATYSIICIYIECVCVYIQRKMLSKYYLFQVK